MIEGLKPYPGYKESGVDWLGDVPEGWRVQRAKWLFHRLVRPVRDEDEVVTCFRDGVVTLRRNRRIRGFTEAIKEHGYQGIRKGDLVIHAMDAFAGAAGVADTDGKGTPVYAVCEPYLGTIAAYYAHVVREMARREWILALSRGIRERSTDFRYEAFGEQSVPAPSTTEQAAIVRFLAHADRRVRRLITAKQTLIKLLGEQKRAQIAAALTEVETASGACPRLPLKRVLHRLVDCEHKTAPFVESSEYRVIRTTGVRDGKLRMFGTYCTTPEAFALWTARATPEAGDVVFTREAPAGEACVVPDGLPLCLGQRTVLMKLRRDRYDPEFLLHMIYSGPARERIRLASQGSTVGHFNMDDIASMPVLVPSLETQRTMVRRIDRESSGSEATLATAQREITLLREYRTRLIADVVTGKLDVRAAAAALSDESDDVAPLEEADDVEGENEEVEPDGE